MAAQFLIMCSFFKPGPINVAVVYSVYAAESLKNGCS